MKPVPRKKCSRCGRQHSRKGVRYCDPCERVVRAGMEADRYLEDRHIPKRPQGDRVQISQE